MPRSAFRRRKHVLWTFEVCVNIEYLVIFIHQGKRSFLYSHIPNPNVHFENISSYEIDIVLINAFYTTDICWKVWYENIVPPEIKSCDAKQQLFGVLNNHSHILKSPISVWIFPQEYATCKDKMCIGRTLSQGLIVLNGSFNGKYIVRCAQHFPMCIYWKNVAHTFVIIKLNSRMCVLSGESLVLLNRCLSTQRLFRVAVLWEFLKIKQNVYHVMFAVNNLYSCSMSYLQRKTLYFRV